MWFLELYKTLWFGPDGEVSIVTATDLLGDSTESDLTLAIRTFKRHGLELLVETEWIYRLLGLVSENDYVKQCSNSYK